MSFEKYNQLVSHFQTKNIKISDKALDILAIFAQKDYVSAVRTSVIIKSTKLEMKYTNVLKWIKHLDSLNLIEKVQVQYTVRNNEKYYRLTEEGIYQLFLNRLEWVLADQLSVRKGDTPISNIRIFLKHYGKSMLFESFIYPYFESHILSTENIDLLIELFYYLSDCCKQVDKAVRIAAIVPVKIPKFSWNDDLKTNKDELLISLKQIFQLEILDSDNLVIEKSPEELKIASSKFTIRIKLDRKKRKAIAVLGKYRRKYEFDIVEYGSEIFVCTSESPEESMKKVSNVSQLIEAPIYRLVSKIGTLPKQEVMNSANVLAQDTKFMMKLENLHIDFERGYQHLHELRRL
jgi:DNA-binding PadR family transcriptional regulator